MLLSFFPPFFSYCVGITEYTLTMLISSFPVLPSSPFDCD
jgi:hypothetical protein